MSIRRVWSLGCLLWVISACTAPEPEPGPFGPVETWALVDTLFDPIGTADGPPTHTLYRVHDARYLGSGLLALANAREEIRLFRTDGSFVRQFGRRGDGPGEYGELSRLFRLNDASLLAVDEMRLRVLRFDTLGHFLGGFRLDPKRPIEAMAGYAVLGPDRLMAIGHSYLTSRPLTTVQTLIRPEVPLYIIDSARGAVEVDRVLGQPRFVDGGGWRAEPLGPSTLISTWRDGAVIAFGDHADLHFYDAEGSLLQIVTSPRVPPPVTAQTITAWEQELREAYQRSGMPPEQPFWPPGWELVFPDSLPVYYQPLADDEGCVWVSRYRSPGETMVWYDVIDPENRSMATFSLPKTTIITDVKDGLVVGVHTDDLGVQRIVLLEVDTGGKLSNLRCDTG